MFLQQAPINNVWSRNGKGMSEADIRGTNVALLRSAQPKLGVIESKERFGSRRRRKNRNESCGGEDESYKVTVIAGPGRSGDDFRALDGQVNRSYERRR